MKQFYEFEQYLLDHANELMYDSTRHVNAESFPAWMNAEYVKTITSISVNSTLAVLRAYHEWASESDS